MADLTRRQAVKMTAAGIAVAGATGVASAQEQSGQQPEQRGAAAAAGSNRVGLFLTRWDIGDAIPGAPTFVLSGTVDTVRDIFNGSCRMSQAIHPPPDFASNVQGTISYMTVMPDQTHILVVATGTYSYTLPPPAIGTVTAPNLHLRMVLSDDWKTGVAHVQYFNDGLWSDLNDVAVRIDPVSETPTDGE